MNFSLAKGELNFPHFVRHVAKFAKKSTQLNSKANCDYKKSAFKNIIKGEKYFSFITTLINISYNILLC